LVNLVKSSNSVKEPRMLTKSRFFYFVVFLSMLAFGAALKGGGNPSIPAGAKVYVAPMGGFETYLKAALQAKKVPLEVVEKKEDAAYEITGVSETKKAGAAKILITGSWHSREEASIQVTDLKAGVVAFAYSYVTENSTHGKKSSAEACAKHLKDAIKTE
jgi:hypothetical protein